MGLVEQLRGTADPASRAEKLLAELVSPLDRPNQAIINDLVSLIHALASNPNSNVNLHEIVETARLLIEELIKPIPSPNKILVEELINIVVECAQPAPKPVAAPAPVQSSAPTATSQDNGPVLKLLTGEIKELTKKVNEITASVKDVENKMNGKTSVISDDLTALKSSFKKTEAKVEEMAKNIDKFLSLYEVIINQYNPFVEHVEGPKSPAPVQAPPAPKPIEVSANDLSELIEKIRAMSESDFNNQLPALMATATKLVNDATLVEQLKTATKQTDFVKLLIKKSLKISMGQ